MAIDLAFLNTYPDKVRNKILTLIDEDGLVDYLQDLYPENHKIHTDKALFDYVQDLRKNHMKKARPAHKVVFDEKNESVYNALGDNLNDLILTDNGHKIKNVIRIASVFKDAPADLFHMVVVHEVAHLKERDHSNNFFRLCQHMDGDYEQHELDLRLFLITKGY